ncbi:diacylglycerol/lipid kinase family protein [Allokutzneria albata]|uniref:Diacylglycerol kinase family enzyme n=1 Tax=Allokutzneria albata TaxID=211114 RepID=A0A1G9SBB7_ALLAB|nr:diacylglycerol kinase family protein [Allokutzneria albata]SDM32768.1 Diacylglycerol kinase family enzyme [Allokutzneria albata]
MSARGREKTRLHVVIVANTHSGGGKLRRFRLIERAERLGAQIRVIGEGQSASSLARAAVEQGAEVLGVAGGDGTVSAVAAVAAATDHPLLVIPAGTRNHFARDLGLDIRNPGRALPALLEAESARVDLGVAGSRIFVNNVSFGIYAEALLEPRYREAKARTLVSLAPGYIGGQRWVEAIVDAPQEAIECPQVVLVSNNPYQLSPPRHLGRRFALATGLLGALVIKRPPEPPAPPDLLPRLRRALLRQASAGLPETGVVTWSAPQVVLHGSAPGLPAGIDGEPVELSLPVRCEIRPGALRVLLPKRWPGM